MASKVDRIMKSLCLPSVIRSRTQNNFFRRKDLCIYSLCASTPWRGVGRTITAGGRKIKRVAFSQTNADSSLRIKPKRTLFCIRLIKDDSSKNDSLGVVYIIHPIRQLCQGVLENFSKNIFISKRTRREGYVSRVI